MNFKKNNDGIALGIRLIGLLLQMDKKLLNKLVPDRESILNCIIIVLEHCKTIKQTVDTQRIQVNCSMVISLLMKGPYSSMRKTVQLDTALLYLPVEPVETPSLMESLYKPAYRKTLEECSEEEMEIPVRRNAAIDVVEFQHEVEDTEMPIDMPKKKKVRFGKEREKIGM